MGWPKPSLHRAKPRSPHSARLRPTGSVVRCLCDTENVPHSTVRMKSLPPVWSPNVVQDRLLEWRGRRVPSPGDVCMSPFAICPGDIPVSTRPACAVQPPGRSLLTGLGESYPPGGWPWEGMSASSSCSGKTQSVPRSRGAPAAPKGNVPP